ncbi:efflux RND transporter periplasmic adaptor subunit [Qipengyuania sp. XHP0207]|uniref:efflux RND transporter periplasmic adaptor subunit n=1 Tax=Qipengyuania sp. XHP0207 TaxID=3038078 RepID=UPI00241E280F|nr:efflux RND transporter periplasmic adaptor subunit [Qipengyuania sp. XHP0207]MDG5748150.1 efflux RND transporter periplasmic adaptor subunit [Qipengyuania sp. XHP0207]
MNYESGFQADNADLASPGDTVEGAEQPGRSRNRLYWIIAAIALLAIIAAAYYAFSGGAADEGAGEDSQLPTVTVIRPGSSSVEGVITATGTLAARRDLPVGVVGEGGRVTSVPVDEGSWVRQGQVLAVIDRSVQSQQAQSAAAQIQVAQADANLAQANLDRALQLVERGFVSTADVDRLTATRDAAVARVRVAQAQLRELRARNARLNIVAPASGLVLERNVEVGQTVSAGSPPLFRIARGGEMELEARLGEADLARVSVGTQAEVSPVGSDRVFSGQIWQVSPLISQQDRQGTARIALPYAPALRPGGFATARIVSGTVTAPILPESAVLSDDDGAYVYVIDADNTAQRRAIETGAVTPKGIVVTGGLTGTEQVVLRAGGFLNPGETVSPQLQGSEG